MDNFCKDQTSICNDDGTLYIPNVLIYTIKYRIQRADPLVLEVYWTLMSVRYNILFNPKPQGATEQQLRAEITNTLQSKGQNYITNAFRFRDKNGLATQEVYIWVQ